MQKKWFIDTSIKHEKHCYEVERYLIHRQTKCQTVDIIKNPIYGKCLFLNNTIQSSQLDEFIFHESLVHPAVLSHKNPKKVLIIGGGEGATLREVLKYDISRVVMVDIDKELVEICKKFLPEWHRNAFDDRRVEILYEDGKKYIEDCKEKFDVVIMDSCDPIDPLSTHLFDKSFYLTLFKKMANDGIASIQSGYVSLDNLHFYKKFYQMLCNIFPIVRCYRTFIQSFFAEWTFTIASKKYDPKSLSKRKIESWVKKAKLKFYDYQSHLNLFNLPRFMRNL